MHTQQFSDYIVYVDESGDHSLGNIDEEYPFFVLAFCIFKKSDYLQVIQQITALKFKYFGHDKVVNQKLMAELFDKDSDTIGLHIKNIFSENELDENLTTELFSMVQTEGKRNVTRQIKHYILDVIISVGYRVNSKRGTQFRIWANKVLKDYIINGYALNHNIIDTTHKEYQQLLDLLNNTLINNQLVTAQGQNILALINDYAITWSSLLQYDEDRLAIPSTIHTTSVTLDYASSLSAITAFKANLLGIGSFLFVLYLQLNKLATNINNIGLTSLALLVAESNPTQKDLIIRLIINLLVTK